MSISRGWPVKIAVPLVLWILSVPLADGAFRLAGDRPSRDLQGLFTAVGDSGYKLGSNLHTWAEFYTGRMDVYTDDLGMRCGSDRASRTASGDTIDVLYLGDSQGFGNLLNYEETIVGQLSKRGAGRGLRMGNASVGGSYLSNQLEIAGWLHDQRKTTIRRIVVLLTPVMVRAAGAYNRVTVGADGRLYEGQPSRLSKLVLWAKTNTVVYARVRGAFRQIVGLRGALGRLLGVRGADPVAVRLYENGPRLTERRDALIRILAETRDWARSIGATLDLVYTPLVVELDFDPVQNMAREIGASVDVDAPLRLSKLAAENLGIGFLDLRPALVSVRNAGQPLSMEADSHYTPATSAAVANLIWDSLFAR